MVQSKPVLFLVLYQYFSIDIRNTKFRLNDNDTQPIRKIQIVYVYIYWEATFPCKMPLRLAQVAIGWVGNVGGFRFNSQLGKRVTYQNKKREKKKNIPTGMS